MAVKRAKQKRSKKSAPAKRFGKKRRRNPMMASSIDPLTFLRDRLIVYDFAEAPDVHDAVKDINGGLEINFAFGLANPQYLPEAQRSLDQIIIQLNRESKSLWRWQQLSPIIVKVYREK